MKKLRKVVLSLAVVVLVSFANPTTVNAASGINSGEQAVLNALSSGVSLAGRTVNIPAEYVNQARNYMISDGVDITDAQASEIVSEINEAFNTAASSGLDSLSKINAASSGIMNIIVSKVENAAKSVGLNVSVDLKGNKASIYDSNGTLIWSASNIIKQTGMDLTTSAVMGIGAISLLGVCAIIAKKRNLFA